MTDKQQTMLDTYWEQFKGDALKGAKPDNDLTYERRIWFAGVVAVMTHVAQVRDIDAVVGRVGELARELDVIAKREIEAGVDGKGQKPGPDVCYDGS